MSDPLDLIHALLAGEPGAGEGLPPAVRAEAFGVEAFGGLGVAELLALDPVSLSPRPHVVRTAQGLALFDTDAEGGEVAVVADLFDGVIGRLWRVGAAGPGAASACREPPTPVAFDPFLSQARSALGFVDGDLPDLDPDGRSALREVVRREAVGGGPGRPRVLAARAFGTGEGAAALLVVVGAPAPHRHVAAAFRYDADELLHLRTVPDAPHVQA